MAPPGLRHRPPSIPRPRRRVCLPRAAIDDRRASWWKPRQERGAERGATVGADAHAAMLPRRSDGERCAPPRLGWPRACRSGGVRRERPGAGRRRGRDPRRHVRRSRPLRCVHRSAGRGFQPLRASASSPSFKCVPLPVAHARHRQLGAANAADSRSKRAQTSCKVRSRPRRGWGGSSPPPCPGRPPGRAACGKRQFGSWLPLGCRLANAKAVQVAAVARLTIRLTDRMSEQLAALAHARGLSRARFVR
jgi:hypothetical protein